MLEIFLVQIANTQQHYEIKRPNEIIGKGIHNMIF